MKLERKVGTGKIRGRRMGWLSGGLLFALALTAMPEVALAQFPVEIGSTIMNRNRAIVIIANGLGQAGSIASGSSVGNGGFWITTQNPYIFAAGPTIGARIPAPGGAGLDTVAFIGGPFSQVLPGSVSDPKLANVGGAGVLWDTANPDPAVIEQFPEDCTVDATRVAQFPALGSFQGLPFPGFADQTVCVATNDIDGAVCDDCAGTRMGVEVISTWFAFSVPEVQDFIFFIFRIYNRSELINATNSPNQISGPYDLQDVSVAIAADPDIGDSGDDQITFFPAINTMVAWDNNFIEPTFIGTPGFAAFNYLRTPIDPATGEEVGLANFTLFSRTGGRPDPENPQEWYQGLTGDPGFSLLTIEPTDIRGMAASDLFDLPAGEFVEIYGAIFFAPVQGAPPTELLAEAPFVQQGGQLVVDPTANFDQGTAPGNPFQLIVETQGTAQTVFDLGFIVPTAPPKPNFELIPGDHQVTILWEANSVEAVNPFAKVARDPFVRLANLQPDPEALGTGVFLEADQVIFDPNRDQGGLTGFLTVAEAGLTGREVTNLAFNPDFLIQDFQGFRVYRSRTGSPADAALIAQFDLADAITGGSFCTAAEEVFSGGVFVDAVCTNILQLPIGTNTTLSFAVVDRGGEFPTPGIGPGLINGIPVAYSVTAYAVNPGQSPVGRLSEEGFAALVPAAAPLVLESGLLPFERATPRSDASSLVGATVGQSEILDGAGNVVAPGQNLPVDADGNLTGPIPPANSGSLSVQIVNGAAIPDDFEVRVVIDSVPVSPGWASSFGCGGDDTAETCVFGVEGVFNEVPAGDGRARQVWFHVEDGQGNRLDGPLGPAGGVVLTDFISFGGAASFTSPSVEVLSPIDPSLGVAFAVQFTSSIGRRDGQCSLNDICVLTTPGGAGPPASVADFTFSRGLYGQYRYADIELTWSNSGGALGLSSVQDVSNSVDLFFTSGFGTEQWGFARATGLASPEAAEAAGIPTTADGKVLFPSPFCDFPGNCVNYGFLTPFTQAAPVWTDLPFDPDVFEKLAPFRGSYAAIPLHQPGALSETAALVNVGGQQGTRLYISGHWLDVVFSSLPADGETWLVRLPNLTATAPRPIVPGMALRAELSGSTNEIANADLSQIRVVPNPFVVTNAASAGVGRQNMLFTHLPPQATIRIFTISGNLIRVLEHSSGSGTEEWDLRTRFDLVVASGNYYFHVTTPDGQTHLGRFAVVN